MAEARNYFKVRVLYFLSEQVKLIDEHGEGWAWLTATDIAQGADVNSKSAYVLLPRWRKASWGYVDGLYMTGELTNDARPHWFYRINSKGMAYLARLHKWYKYYDEAKAAVDAVDAEAKIPFKVPRKVGWHVQAYDESYKRVLIHSVVMEWPFENKVDVHRYYYPIKNDNHYYLCADIKHALKLISKLFNLEPSTEVVKYAISMQNYLLSTAVEHAQEFRVVESE